MEGKNFLSVDCFATVEKYLLLPIKVTMATDNNNRFFSIRQSPIKPERKLVPCRASLCQQNSRADLKCMQVQQYY